VRQNQAPYVTYDPARDRGARALLEQVGLREKKDRYPARLSGGERQRVAIVRALCLQPKAMLFDEITSALDPELVGEVLDVIKGPATLGMTMVVVTHEMEFTRDVADRLIFMDQGLVVEEGAPDAVLRRPQNERTRTFLRRVIEKSAKQRACCRRQRVEVEAPQARIRAPPYCSPRTQVIAETLASRPAAGSPASTL
jgi:ABC-type methionine transport system ATPase subunit